MLNSHVEDIFHVVRLAPLVRGDLDLSVAVKVTGALLCAYLMGLTVYRYLLHPISSFPGPKLAPPSNAYWFWTLLRGNAHYANHDWHKKYGPIVRLGVNHLSFSDHAAQKVIYGFGTKELPSMAKDPEFSTPEVDGTMNIINEVDRDEHTRMRRMLSFAFANTNLLTHEAVLHQRADLFLDDMRGVQSEDGKMGINIVRRFYYVTTDIMGAMAFGDSWDKSSKAGRHDWANVIIEATHMNDIMRAITVIPGLFSLIAWMMPEFVRRTLVQHAEYSHQHTHARLRADTTTKDFVHHMLAAKGQSPSASEIASHFQALMMAGTITTATFLPATLFYLCREPEKRARLETEIRGRFNTRDEITSKALIEDCPYLTAVCEEGLRIYPPAGAAHLPRIVPGKGCEILGRWVPGGTRVSIHPWSVTHDPANFYLPDNFIPERWMPAECPPAHRNDRLDTSTPFHTGPRGCLGKNLAYLEMRIILAKLVWQYDIEWFDPSVDWPRDSCGYTIWKKPDFRVRLRERVVEA